VSMKARNRKALKAASGKVEVIALIGRGNGVSWFDSSPVSLSIGIIYMKALILIAILSSMNSFGICQKELQLILGGLSFHGDNHYKRKESLVSEPDNSCDEAGRCTYGSREYWDSNRPINETNQTIGIQCNSYEITGYINTYYAKSLALTRIDKYWSIGNLSLGSRYGLASGYGDQALINMGVTSGKKFEHINGGIRIVALGIVSYKVSKVTLELGIANIQTANIKIDL